MDKQLKYANATGVRFPALLGPDELGLGTVTLKSLAARTQSVIPRAQLATEIRSKVNTM